MNSLPEPERSAAVIIGVAGYTELKRLPAVANNRDRLKATLTDPEIFGLPEERCLVVPDPTYPKALRDPVVEAARQARDTLIVYYAGHGFMDDKGAFFLTLPDSSDGDPFTAVPYDWLRGAILKHSSAQRRIVILDCCYSGLALETMSDPATELPAAASINGSYLLTSVSENVQALSPKGEECTAFTGELTRALSEGVPDGGEFLTLDTIYGQVRHSLRAKGRPEPQEQDRGQIGRLPFVRNRAKDPSALPPPPPRPRRGCFVAAAVGVVLAAVAVPVTWKLAGDDQRSGRCSQHASLIGHSDQLDKVRYKGRRLAGLSSLTMDGPSRLLSLSDTATPSLYRLSLSSQDKAEVEIDGRTDLRRKDGSEYSGEDFDGEAVALERGGRTVLVASEAGPSVSRFDVRTGKLLTGFPVPERFGIAPQGDGQHSESFEAMALSPDGQFLYVGLESPLSGDGSRQGRSPVRILRYKGTPGGDYVPDRQFAYETGSGLRLADLVATGEDGDLLALERGYAEGQGNAVRMHRISLRDLPDVSRETSLAKAPSDVFAAKRPLFDLADCPASGADAPQKQSNPLLDNVEGAALGPVLTKGEHKGRRVLYLVSDDNASPKQVTRFYALAVAAP
ncbi:hypothetical protein G4Z16_27120 [Streptomyces bathyalis]|uniref:Uncharacterized protein n=1 Tax=Streptomyces bathyalis TaxID=2710756 RepID=A0A7T1WUB2_9ACTN|nr:esterase-like activity of phytase family protein [Streptomyces bathyalis]QPP09476.1 hypothetical protein G4Z16_27120 [Streptomyces bathyalis]